VIVEEVERVLSLNKVRKRLQDPNGAQALLFDLVIFSDVVVDTSRVRGVCRDPADDAVLATAVEGRAAVIVTGDDDLLSLVEYEDIVIMAPKAFADLLER
jgi:putative PIN family toxin of toxin-antitoxin system